jgi:hypothetical protein
MSSLIQSQLHHGIIWKYIIIFSTFLYLIIVARRLNSKLWHMVPPSVLIFSDFCFWTWLLSPFGVDTNSGTPKLELILGSQGFRCAPINRLPCQNRPQNGCGWWCLASRDRGGWNSLSGSLLRRPLLLKNRPHNEQTRFMILLIYHLEICSIRLSNAA